MKSKLLIIIGIGIFGFMGIAFATHDPIQPYIHSIILSFDMKEKTFEEFIEWCKPYYGKMCIELYEKNQVSNVLPPLKQIKSGVPINEIQCNDNLQLILKTRNNSPACVKPETAPKLIERGWGEPAPIPEPDTGEFRYGEQECHYIDEKSESRSCIVSGWTKPVSELDCEEICRPPGTEE